MKNYIKVLSDSDFNIEVKPWQRLILKELEKYYTEITPKFYRNGWYYNRMEDLAWKELNGRAWLDMDSNMFKYALKIQNHKPLLNKEREAITLLINNKLTDRKLKNLLFMDNDIRLFRTTTVSINKRVLEIKRTIL